MCVRHTLQNDVIMHGLHISLHSSLQIFSALTHLFQLSQVSQQFQSKASYMVLAVGISDIFTKIIRYKFRDFTSSGEAVHMW